MHTERTLAKISKSGFTLMELLVVLTIIAILAGLASLGLSQARDKATRAVCASNLRQIGQAIGQHVNDTDRLPGYIWDQWILKYLGMGDIPSSADYKEVARLGGARLNVLRCPGDRLRRTSPADGAPRSYTALSWIANFGNRFKVPNWEADQYKTGLGVPAHYISDPARVGVITECWGNPSGNPGNVACTASYWAQEQPNFVTTSLHNYRANLLFADWHVELVGQMPIEQFRPKYWPVETL